MKLNVGCGTDYRDGFVNIDGSSTLKRVDMIIDISSEKLCNHFQSESVDYILANDIIEHHFHWEAVSILKDFLTILKVGGTLEMRVPDARFIIYFPLFNMQTKIKLLFGGQDIPQHRDDEMDKSRQENPQFFCHKYAWTKRSLKSELESIGYKVSRIHRQKTNIVAIAVKR